MKRIVLDCLPMEDPANEARKIVRRGMADITDSFDDDVWEDWYNASPTVHCGPSPVEPAPPTVDVLVDPERGITFCSKAYDDECRQFEELYAYYRQRWIATLKAADVYGLPRGVILGFDGAR